MKYLAAMLLATAASLGDGVPKKFLKTRTKLVCPVCGGVPTRQGKYCDAGHKMKRCVDGDVSDL
jgi:formate dehydrogenase maturation protein FdhE